jgi:hypothetical protein
MRNPLRHPLIVLLDAFLAPLGDKFQRRYADTQWTPRLVAVGLLMTVLRAYQGGYDSLVRTLGMARPDLVAREPSPSAFCRARRKLTTQMLDLGWQSFRSCMEGLFIDVHPAVFGHRLVAIDGVWLNGRRSGSLFRALRKRQRGRPPRDPQGQPQMLLVVLVDVLTRAPIAWQEVRPGTGERAAAAVLIKHLNHRTILLADRGFPSRKILELLQDSGTRFVIRMTTGATAFAEVQAISGSKRKDRDCQIRLGEKTSSRTLDGRIVRGQPTPAGDTDGGNGQEWILLTNLPRNSRWTRATILHLYHQRWAIETFFRELKQVLNADHFHAQSLDGMRQEICMAMVAAAMISAAEMLALTVRHGRMPTWHDAHQQRCNRATLATTVRQMLLTDPTLREVDEMLDDALGISALRAIKRRPGRRYPRICKSFYGKWKHGFKSKAA